MAAKAGSSDTRVFPKKDPNHWCEGLLNSMRNPDLVVYEDDLIVAMKDLYPKASIHYLVCPKENIPTLQNVKAQHLDLIKHMHNYGLKLCHRHEKVKFLLGYHAVPSMIRLHLHVISDDFDSPCMKTKKHWNSFTTEFFVPSVKVIDELENEGKLNRKTIGELKTILLQPLKCHKCDYKPQHMPDLKVHIKTHIT